MKRKTSNFFHANVLFCENVMNYLHTKSSGNTQTISRNDRSKKPAIHGRHHVQNSPKQKTYT